MVDHQDLPEAAAQCDDMTVKEREVMAILLNLPERIAELRVYGEDQLLPWGWKKRRSAVNYPLTPLPSPADSFPSPSSSLLPRMLMIFKPRVAHTKEQLMQQINELTQRRKVCQQEQLLQQMNELTHRRNVCQQELFKVQSHLEKQIQ